MLEIFSAEDCEILMEEWLDLKKAYYFEIARFCEACDKGRDVAPYITDPEQPYYSWDCYQYKHYDRPLMPSQMWIEFRKIIYYTYNNDYPIPKNIIFE